MQTSEEKALRLLRSQRQLNKEDADIFEILHKFLKDTDPFSGNDLGVAFDITINFLKPPELNVSKLILWWGHMKRGK